MTYKYVRVTSNTTNTNVLLYFPYTMPALKRSYTIVDDGPRTKKIKYMKKRSSSYKSKPKSVTSPSPNEVSMPYHLAGQRTMGNGVVSVTNQVIRGNDIYDPEYALGGHQAFGFDQMSAIYKDFYVKSSSITFSVEGSSNNSSYGLALLWADCNADAAPDVDTAVERCMAAGGKIDRIKSYAAGITTLKHSASTKSLLHSGFEEENNHGSATTGPTQEWYWHLVTTVEDVSLTGRILYTTCEVMYDVLWTESKLNVSS